MVHLRIVAPPDRAQAALECLRGSASVISVIHLAGVATKPDGDVILCDVAREDASVVISDLRDLGLDEEGTIAVEDVDSAISTAADRAEQAAEGSPSDAVVWEEVTSRTLEESGLSASFLAFIVLAVMIASVGIYLNSPILIVGAMVVGPDFGPIAGVCVAVVQRRPDLAGRSFAALAVGFPLAILIALGASLIFKATGITPEHFTTDKHQLASTIASPGFFAVFVAFCAGIVGMLSLSTSKSGALIGVLISVTTIPAAADVAVSAAYGEGATFRGSLGQLAINIASLLVAGILTLSVQRLLYRRRRREHHGESGAAGGPGRPRREPVAPG